MEYYPCIDLMRIVFAEMIVYYHLVGELKRFYPDIVFFSKLSSRAATIGTYCVIAFFMISGFLFVKSEMSKRKSARQFVIEKLVRLWPALAFSFFINFNGMPDFLNLFFINTGSGFIKYGSSNPATWYVCNLFWISLVFHFLIPKDYADKHKTIGKLLVLALISFAMLGRIEKKGYYMAAFSQIPFLTAGWVYTLLGFSVGILLAFFIDSIPKNEKIKPFVEFIWLCLFCWFIYSISLKKVKFEGAFYIICSVFLLLFSVLYSKKNIRQKTLLTSRIVWGGVKIMGQSSYGIYIMQFPCFFYYKKILTHIEGLQKLSPLVIVLFGMILCTVSGILVHILIEKPIIYLYKKFRLY